MNQIIRLYNLNLQRIYTKLLPFFLVFFLLSVCGCQRQDEKPINVSLTESKKTSQIITQNPSDQKLRIAVSAVISPKETFILYKELFSYISEKLNRPVEFIQRETYIEVNNMIRDQELDLAFVCSGAYVDGHDKFGMEILVAPVAYGEPLYHSYIIVPVTSLTESFDDLRGKSFAFTDPMSNSGKLSPTFMLAQMNEDMDSFFKSYIFTYSHDRSIEMVAHALVDGAAVDGLIWEYMNTKSPSLTSKTKIIKKSEPYGIPPVVIPGGLDPGLKTDLRNLFLTIHTDEKGEKILAKLLIDKFIDFDDAKYDSIREMRKWVNQK